MLDISNINKYCITPRYFKAHYPDIYEKAMALGCKKFSEAIYLLCGGLRGYCLECGKPTTFHSITDGYQPYCCAKCSNQSLIKREKISQTALQRTDEERAKIREKTKQTYAQKTDEERAKTQEKYKRTCMERYGRSSGLDVEKSKKTKLERYGDENYRNTEKSKQTCMERYGVPYSSQAESVKEKTKQTCLERYGTPSYIYKGPSAFLRPEVQEKARKTRLERYGVEYAQQCPAIRNKTIRTNMKKLGVPCNLMSEDSKEKIKQTCTERYGVENPMQSEEIREKAMQTNLERYGVEHPAQAKGVQEKAKQTCLERYGVPYSGQAESVKEKAIQTNLERYGVEYPAQSKEVQEKVIQTNLERHGVPYGLLNTIPGYSKSSQEYFKSLDEQYPNAMYATKGNEYRVGPYLLDWYDPDSNTVIEFNGDYWHANPKLYNEDWIHPIKKCTAKELWEHDREKKEYLEALGYKVKVVWESEI